VSNSFFENNQDLKNRKAQTGHVTIKKRYPIILSEEIENLENIAINLLNLITVKNIPNKQ
jgi:hypothetical protein